MVEMGVHISESKLRLTDMETRRKSEREQVREQLLPVVACMVVMDKRSAV